MLEERRPEPYLRRPDDLATVHHDLAADRRCETRAGTGAGRTAVLRRELRRDAERPERCGEALVNHAVALLQRCERGDGSGDGGRAFVLVPDGAAAGRAEHDVPATTLDL